MIRATRYVTREDGTFVPDPEDGGDRAHLPMAILGVKDRDGDLVDLACWYFDVPTKWWMRFADECPILGAQALAIAAWYHRRITLYPTPEVWLRARLCDGDRDTVCILDWEVDLRPLFDGVSDVRCVAPHLEARLRRSLRRFEPRITTPCKGVRHAA